MRRRQTRNTPRACPTHRLRSVCPVTAAFSIIFIVTVTDVTLIGSVERTYSRQRHTGSAQATAGIPSYDCREDDFEDFLGFPFIQKCIGKYIEWKQRQTFGIFRCFGRKQLHCIKKNIHLFICDVA